MVEQHVFAVDRQESLNCFEASQLDIKTCHIYTQTFFLGEPVVYHPGHLSSPVCTHISEIHNDNFTCAHSTTARTIPIRQARFLLLKLSLSDIDAATKGPDLPLGERMWWRRWFETENARCLGKQKVCAPCCGRVLKRYQLAITAANTWTCPRCKVGDWEADQSAPQPPTEVQHSAHEAWSHHWTAQPQPNGQPGPSSGAQLEAQPSSQPWSPLQVQQESPQEQQPSDAHQLEQQFVPPKAWPTQHGESPEAEQSGNNWQQWAQRPPESHPPQPLQSAETPQLEQQSAEAWPTHRWEQEALGAMQRTPGAVQLGEQPEQPQPPPNEASYPWRQTQAPPPKRSRAAAERGVITTWRQERYGFARFLGIEERVLVHQSDCVDHVLQVGDCVTGHLHRRRHDGKLQLFKVSKAAVESPVDERVHAALLGLA